MSASRSGGAVSSSAVSAARSTWPASTVSISGTGVAACSWSAEPMRATFGRMISPEPALSSPLIRRKRVVLPAPLRPTRPTFAPTGSAAEAESKKRRP